MQPETADGAAIATALCAADRVDRGSHATQTFHGNRVGRHVTRLVDDYLKSLSPNPERITPALIQML
jgi:hypothetical protein